MASKIPQKQFNSQAKNAFLQLLIDCAAKKGFQKKDGRIQTTLLARATGIPKHFTSRLYKGDNVEASYLLKLLVYFDLLKFPPEIPSIGSQLIGAMAEIQSIVKSDLANIPEYRHEERQSVPAILSVINQF